MTTKLFDGTNHPSAETLIADGLAGALVYAGTPASTLGKDVTADQYADYKAHGLLVMLVYESSSDDIAGGTVAGARHAHDFFVDCHAKGVDVHDPACAAVDEHLAAGDLPTAVAYQRAFRDTLRSLGWTGPIGGYGFPEVLDAFHTAGVADWYWGCGRRADQPPYVNVWQDNTGTILVGGAADDQDWVLTPLPQGGTVTAPDPWAEQVIDPSTGKPALDIHGQPYTYGQSWAFVTKEFWADDKVILGLPAQLAAITSALADLKAAVDALKPPPITLVPSGSITFAPPVAPVIAPVVVQQPTTNPAAPTA